MAKINYSKLFTRRKDGVYQKCVNGKYIYSKDPEKLYAKMQELLAGEPEKTFRQVGEEWERIHREEIGVRTWNNYSPHYSQIMSEHGDKKISEISARDIDLDLKICKAKGYSATIIKSRKAIYSMILGYAVVNKYIRYNPANTIKNPKTTNKTIRRAPTDAEIKTILASVDAPFGFFPFFLLCTGLRKSEALALTRQDINLDNGTISVTKALEYIDNSKPSVKPPKTESSIREVPILSILRPELEKHLAELSGNIIFPAAKSNRNPGGGYIGERGYEVAWKRYCDATGIDLTAHQLRHGAATLMFEAGVDVYTTQRLLGHSNITTTMQIYTELREKQQAKSIEKFDESMSKYISGGKENG